MAPNAKAAVLVGPRSIEVRQFPIPDTGDDDGILQVEATGVCGSDIPPFLSGRTRGGGQVILGHEIVGRVARLGKTAAAKWGVKEGDRIIVEEHLPCGACEICYAGEHRICANLRRFGGLPIETTPSIWGGFADHLYLDPASVVYKAPENLPAEQVALFIPISNGINWVHDVGNAGVGDTIVIQGPGQHGLGCVIGAVEWGCNPIIVIGLSQDETRLQLALELGATHIIRADREDAVQRVKEITNGRMADTVIDATAGPHKPSIKTSLELVKRVGATIALAGGIKAPPSDEPLPGGQLMTLKTVWGRDPRSVRAALKIMESGKYPLHKLTTHHFGVEDTELALLTAAREGRGGIDPIHVSITP